MSILSVAILVDLLRNAGAGGHVKYWERLAEACAKENAPIDLTVYFLGDGADEVLSPHVRFRFLPPVFSTARLKFLPYVPAHTDLAPFHPELAKKLPAYDILHTTGGFFSFARTAERVSRECGIPLVTSFHTDTLAYAELFTHQTLQSLLGKKIGNAVDAFFKISLRERRSKEKRLKKHLRACKAVLAMRPEDRALALGEVSPENIKPMRLGVDKNLFKPHPDARAEIESECKIAPGKFLALFVGRVDAGKNIPLFLQACAQAMEKGANLHLIVVGIGPLSDEVKTVLGDNATLAGWVSPEKLARLYAAADCLSMASDIEIGGLVGVEALACGCPVLTSRLNGIAALYGPTPAVKEVESDAVAWAEALTELSQNEMQQRTMREAALTFRNSKLAAWSDVLKEDFLPVWQNVARKEQK
jgi:glycosyltransferase involved in cell wall biosynthesis